MKRDVSYIYMILGGVLGIFSNYLVFFQALGVSILTFLVMSLIFSKVLKVKLQKIIKENSTYYFVVWFFVWIIVYNL